MSCHFLARSKQHTTVTCTGDPELRWAEAVCEEQRRQREYELDLERYRQLYEIEEAADIEYVDVVVAEDMGLQLEPEYVVRS